MCVILRLKKDQTLPYPMFENATLNNPHGYGILYKDNNKIELRKDFSESGNDPEKIYRFLEECKDIERWVHLRWATKGSVDLSNTQPFPVYSSNKKDLYFMHNGTIHGYGQTQRYQNHHGNWVDVPQEGDSDTKAFADELTEILSRFSGEKGKADIQDPVFKKIMEKFWSHGNGKAVIVSSDQEPLFFNRSSWKDLKITDQEETILSSNDDYFDRVRRGPVYEQREAARRAQEKKAKEQEQEQKEKSKNSELEVIPLTCPAFSKRFSASEKTKNLLAQYDIYHPAGYISLSNLSLEEMTALVDNNREDVPWLMMALTGWLREEVEEKVLIQRQLEELKNENGRTVSAQNQGDEKNVA